MIDSDDEIFFKTVDQQYLQFLVRVDRQKTFANLPFYGVDTPYPTNTALSENIADNIRQLPFHNTTIPLNYTQIKYYWIAYRHIIHQGLFTNMAVNQPPNVPQMPGPGGCPAQQGQPQGLTAASPPQQPAGVPQQPGGPQQQQRAPQQPPTTPTPTPFTSSTATPSSTTSTPGWLQPGAPHLWQQ